MENREYHPILVESETEWEKSGSKSINNGWRRYVHRGVDFQAESLETAKNIAISFAQFFEPNFIPQSWEKINRHQFTNKHVQQTFDADGFMTHERTVSVTLADLTAFENQRQERRHGRTEKPDTLQLSLFDKR